MDLELGLWEGGRTRGKACHGDGCLGQHAWGSRWVDGWITCSKSWVVGQDDSHDWSHIRAQVGSWSNRLHVRKVLDILQILNGLHLHWLHA